MSSQPKPCSKCDGEVSLATLDAFKGEEAGVRVTVKGMPAYVCKEGHKRFVSPDFSMQFLDRLLSSEQVLPAPTAQKRGLFRKHYHCSKCGEPLEEASAGAARAERTVEVKGGAPFAVTMEFPVYRCGKCKAEHLRESDEVAEAVMKATAHAFRDVDVHPS